MHETMNFQLWKERREEAMREVERNCLAKAFRETRKLRAGRSSALVWGDKAVHRRPPQASEGFGECRLGTEEAF